MEAAGHAIRDLLKNNTALKELDLSNNYGGASEGAKGTLGLAMGVAQGLEDNGSLSKLDLSKNELRSEGLSALAGAFNKTAITSLNLAENELSWNSNIDTDMSGIIKFAEGIKDMGSLSKLKMNTYELPVQKIKTATELDLSNKGLGQLDVIVIAVLIKVCKL